MKVLYLLVWAALAGVAVGQVNPASLLDVAVPPPPSRHIASPLQAVQAAAAVEQEHASLLETGVAAKASLAARVAAETALAVDESVVAAASVEDTVSAKGQLSAEEQALVSRMIPVPNTQIPSDPAVPIVYSAPPTRDTLKATGPRGYPWPEKLKAAKTTIENEAKKRIHNIRRAMKWSDAAKKLVSQLGVKHSKVNAHVAALTKEIKALLAKKKQIQNKQLQDKLVERLEQTHNNLKKVRRQTHNIRKNQAKMIHHKEELAHALEGIKRSLAILKGMKRKRKFPQRGAGRKLSDELSKFDPDLSHEAEADEVRALQFPDAVFAEVDEQQQDASDSAEAEAQAEEEQME